MGNHLKKPLFSAEVGLSSQEAAHLLRTHGLNQLPEQPPPSSLEIFIAQLKNPLVYVLLCAGLLTFVLDHVSDTIIILFSVLINTVLGFIQEKKANESFAALKQFVTQSAEVIRDGVRMKLETTQLVPGDIVILTQGTKVPADGELVFANRVFFEEAIITGESAPIAKVTGDPVFMGTTVSVGQANMRITATGVHTKIGAIADRIQQIEGDTPLRRQLNQFSTRLVVLIISLTLFVLAVGLLRGNHWVEMLTTSVALAVSSIPEGLIVSLTVVLAVGMQKILKRRGLVKKLASAETLGGVTTICIDKTGTITEGKMQVVGSFGPETELAQQVLLANDLDDPLVIAAFDWGQKKLSTQLVEQFPRLDSIPFSSQERFFTSLHRWDKTHNRLFVNGAPDAVLQWTTLSAKAKAEVAHQIDQLTQEGRRLVGFARKTVPLQQTTLTAADAKRDLEWVGLLAFFDPVRETVQANLRQAQQAGIKLIVITGDYAKTTEFVMREIGQPVTPDQIMTGDELTKLSAKQLAEKIKTIRLFARTTPDQKHLIVTALQNSNEVVGMMGDGVNDAPAIHQADIGIAVNEASDVARESADLVLLDSNFSTIVAAVEEGRGIFDNIRKVTLYLLCDAFAEILVVLGSILLQLPLPITAVQIIWINLVSDGFPNLALTVDAKKPGLMQEPPRAPQEKLVNGWMLGLIGLVSVFAGGVALLAFIVTYTLTQDLAVARSMTFLTLGVNSLAYVFSVRSLLVPFWRSHPFANKWLVLAVVAGLGLQILPFATPMTRQFFSVVQLDTPYWVIAGVLSVGVFLLVELCKTFLNYAKPLGILRVR